MERSTFKIVAAAALILAGTGVAYAKGPGFDGARMNFEDIDADGSGEITVDDLAALADAKFAEMDADGNGSVSEAEFVAAAEVRAGERAARMFERMDADGDGVLSRDALEARGRRGPSERMIARLDADGSGGVSAEEFEAGMEKFSKRRKGRRGHDRGHD